MASPCPERHRARDWSCSWCAEVTEHTPIATAVPTREPPLDWQPHQFLDERGELIQCAIHGALFAIETGLCLRGPCAGRSLQALPVQLTDEGLLVLGRE